MLWAGNNEIDAVLTWYGLKPQCDPNVDDQSGVEVLAAAVPSPRSVARLSAQFALFQPGAFGAWARHKSAVPEDHLWGPRD